jgi:hypothetical protein
MKNFTMALFQIAKDKLSHDLLEGEVIAIHYETGTYYSMRDTAAVIWLKLAEPISLDSLASHFVQIDQKGLDRLQSFLDSLKQEGLITCSDGSDVKIPRGTDMIVFSEPTFEKYTDMQALLLADPIHDVELQAGWPHLKSDAES